MRAIEGGSRRALARCLSLCESRLAGERAEGEGAARLLARRRLLQRARAHRVGFTGPPGAGKSSLIEALGVVSKKNLSSLVFSCVSCLFFSFSCLLSLLLLLLV